MPNLRELLDRAKATNEADKARLATAAAGSTSLANPLGLRFAPGAAVIYLATGQAGRVRSGMRDPQTGQDVFRVELADARIVHANSGELEPAPIGGQL